MQTTLLPKTLCNDMEKLQRKFIWGNGDGGQGYHSIAWDKFCQPKLKGGMRIKNMHEFNQALGMKFGWGLIDKPDALWVQVLRNKYKCGLQALPKVQKSANCSQVWQSVCKVWEKVHRGCKWNIRDGSLARFWKDSWLPSGTILSDHVLTEPPTEEGDLSAMFFLDSNGQ